MSHQRAIMVARPLEDRLVTRGLGEMIVYRPELAPAGADYLAAALLQYQPSVLVLGDLRFEERSASLWRDAVGPRPLGLIADEGVCAAQIRQMAPRHNIDMLDCPTQNRGARDDIGVLAKAEGYLTRNRMLPGLHALGLSEAARSGEGLGRRVVLAGAGIVNLMTAWELVQAGYGVRIMDRAPDPRTRPAWQRLGATHGGENARMFTVVSPRQTTTTIREVVSILG